MSEWVETTLGALIHVKHGFAFKGEFFETDGDEIVLTPGNFKIGGGLQFRPGKEKYYSGEYPSHFRLEAGRLVVVMTDLKQSAPILGSAARVPATPPTLHNQRLGLVEVRAPHLIDEDFLYHLLNDDSSRRQLRATATGATVRHTAPNRIGDISFGLPPIAEQRAIASILGSIDDLIENNRRRIEVLEEMAQAIYREWFVHFRFPGHEDATFIYSPLGPIPDGWVALPSSQALSINPRLRTEKSMACPFVTMRDLSESSLVCHPSDTKGGGSGSKFQNGDTLFARITPCLENGKTGYVASLDAGAVGRGSTEFVVLRGELVGPSFTYFLARDEGFRQHAIKSMSGASGRQRVRNECFDSYLIAAPPTDLAQRFEVVVSGMFELAYAADAEARQLASIRDLLLPKLVTGEIDVSELDLDALVGAAG